jgi:EAL domain-containing protein (putative c-di-GMP-specific phosphodiesterase class I)
MTHRLPPAAVVFEVTEQVAVRYLDSARAVMRELRALGCRFALDDFGAGFSSFGYLKHLPVDFIKIDQSFVEGLARNPVDLALIRGITDIARALGKKVIAEHVSDAESITLLRECGVDYVQGFFIAEPQREPLETLQPASSADVAIVKSASSGRAMH